MNPKHVAAGWAGVSLSAALARRLIAAGLLEPAEYKAVIAEGQAVIDSMRRATGNHPALDEATALLGRLVADRRPLH